MRCGRFAEHKDLGFAVLELRVTKWIGACNVHGIVQQRNTGSSDCRGSHSPESPLRIAEGEHGNTTKSNTERTQRSLTGND